MILNQSDIEDDVIQLEKKFEEKFSKQLLFLLNDFQSITAVFFNLGSAKPRGSANSLLGSLGNGINSTILNV